VSGKSILVIGGEVNGEFGSSRRVDAYNVETKTWRRLAPLPEGRFWHDATTINGKVYVAGGNNEATINGVPTDIGTNTLFVYDPATNAWSRKANMPVNRRQVVRQAGLSGALYVYVGDHFWKYNQWEDKWISLPLPPSGHGDGVMRAVGDKIYLTGGRKVNPDLSGSYNPELDVYDPATRTWTVKSPLPAAYNDLDDGAFAASFNGKLWVGGGALVDNGGPASSIYVYDPLTDTWAAGPTMLRPTKNATAAYAAGKLFVFGGNNSIDLTQSSSFVEALITPP
jgi:N-acetylneuraminic acid mutarotase